MRAVSASAVTFNFSSAITSHWLTSARAVLWWKSRRRFFTFRYSFASARRSRLRFPEPALGALLAALQARRSSSAEAVKETRIGYYFTVRGGEEACYAHIHADLRALRQAAERVLSR